MPTYLIEHPTTGQKIQLEGDGVPSDADIREAFSHVAKSATSVYRGDKSGRNVSDMEKEFLQKEGTLGTQIRNTPISEYAKEPLRFATETALMPVNALGRGLKSAASLVQGGAEAIRTGSLDAGAQKYNKKQAEFKPIESPMNPSAMGTMIATGAKKATDYASELTGRPDIVEPVAQGAMDIGALMGLKAAAPSLRAGLSAGAKGAVNTAGNVGSRALLAAGEKVGVTPEKLYASSLKQSTAIPFEQRAANVKTGLEGEYIPNKAGLGKLYDNIDGLNNQISSAIKESSQGGKTIPVEDIISRLDDVKQRAIDSFGDNNNVIAKIEDFATSLRDHPSVVDGAIPIDVAQKMKVNTYKQLKNAYGELKGFEVEAKKAMARGAKEEIVNQIPELKDLNAKDSTLINLEKVLFKAVNRIENRDMVGIGVPIKIATGAMHGGAGAIAGLVAGLIDTPAIKAHLAIALHKARGRAATPSELSQTISGIKANLAAKLQDERGLVGKDINEGFIYRPNFDGTMTEMLQNPSSRDISAYLKTVKQDRKNGFLNPEESLLRWSTDTEGNIYFADSNKFIHKSMLPDGKKEAKRGSVYNIGDAISLLNNSANKNLVRK